MVAIRPPPTAEELDSLSEAFRRDPSRFFVGLGDALLALGRPRDAVEIGARGLQDDPGNLDGRLMVARAFAALHQWKEAQAELLKVVKADRNHGPAFRMLGEVLMRRADFERALPVLQHAQNLNPADPSILGLLRRARSGQTLEPPPPIPTPVAPASMGRYAPGESQGYALEEQPTRVAGEIDMEGPSSEWDEPALGRVRLERVEHRREGRRAPVEQPVRHSDARGRDEADRRPVEHHMPPPTEDVFAPLGQDPVRERRAGGAPGGFPASMPTAAMPASSMPTAAMPPAGYPGGYPGAGGYGPGAMQGGFAPAGFPPGGFAPGPGGHGMSPGGFPPVPGAPSGVRPRVVAAEKPRDAAQASLRQSAAVGEQYLNNLLMGGLLDIPRVRVPEMSYDLAPGRRWGRSTARIFAYLFVTLFLTIGGGGAWFWYAERQRGEDVERHLETAMPQIEDGEYEGLLAADTETRAAVERDRSSTFAVALLAEVTALECFLYGEIKPAEVQRAIELSAQEIDQPGEQGYRELVIARAAHALSVLPSLEEGAEQRLTEARAGLEKWLQSNKNDRLARWLLGHAKWAAGDRKGARAEFTEADKNGEGPAIAAISLADMMLDDGDYEKARALYDRALKKSPRHPWAFIGRSLTRAERSTEIQEAVSDLNVGVAQKRGPRVEAWKQLAMATAFLTQQDYEAFAKSLDLAVNVKEPRFLARVALLRAQQGKLVDAARARAEIRWYADKPQPDPLVIALDAELHLASGMAREAFAAVEKEGGLLAARLRGRALFDMGRFQQALAELDQALQTSPRDISLQVWAEAARLVEGAGDERRKTEELLDSLGRQSKSKAARVPQAVALIRTGKGPTAREKLELSLKDVSSEYPNALAYRAHVELAMLDREGRRPDQAAEHVGKALELNAGYLPAHDLACQLMADTSADKARQHCGEVIKADSGSLDAELAYVRALTPGGTPPRSAEDLKAAAEALRRAKKKGAGEKELQDYIPRVDTSLFAELGVPEPRSSGRRR